MLYLFHNSCRNNGLWRRFLFLKTQYFLHTTNLFINTRNTDYFWLFFFWLLFFLVGRFRVPWFIPVNTVCKSIEVPIGQSVLILHSVIVSLVLVVTLVRFCTRQAVYRSLITSRVERPVTTAPFLVYFDVTVAARNCCYDWCNGRKTDVTLRTSVIGQTGFARFLCYDWRNKLVFRFLLVRLFIVLPKVNSTSTNRVIKNKVKRCKKAGKLKFQGIYLTV